MDNKRVNWTSCRRILCIRPDNLGDVMLSSPALRALKTSFPASLTLLTSQGGAAAARLNPFIDDVIVFDLPWQKAYDLDPGGMAVLDLVGELRRREFDACVVFTVFSQNPLPCVMLAYLAGIPLRLAYCRENPYGLLTDWIPDQEPYTRMVHQVQRDLELVVAIGATSSTDRLIAEIPPGTDERLDAVLDAKGWQARQPFLLLSPLASEPRRGVPAGYWQAVLDQLQQRWAGHIVLTGTGQQLQALTEISAQRPENLVLAGDLDLPQLAALVRRAAAVLSVNTGTVHLAAALQTPVCVLYARTNPQHTPWKVPHRIFEYSPADTEPSRNEVLAYLRRTHYTDRVELPDAEAVITAVLELCEATALQPDEPIRHQA